MKEKKKIIAVFFLGIKQVNHGISDINFMIIFEKY